MSSDLIQERANKDFKADPAEITSKELVAETQEVNAFQASVPELVNTHKWYDMTREEQLERLYKMANCAYKHGKQRFFLDHECIKLGWIHNLQGENPLNLNYTMFLQTLEGMCNDE